jgi:hypothetical protein
MPFTLIVIVGLVFVSGVIGKVKNPDPKTVTEIVTSKTVEVKSTKELIKPTPKPPEPLKVEAKQPEPIKEEIQPVKEEVKNEAKQIEAVKEEIVTEIKQPELTQEAIKEETKVEQDKLITEDIKLDDPKKDYLKIILYIIAAIATIFGGFYFFSSRGNSQSINSTVDAERKDIEENNQSLPEEPQPLQEEDQTAPQGEQFNQNESQPAEQEQQSAEEEPQPATQDQQTDDPEENNNK